MHRVESGILHTNAYGDSQLGKTTGEREWHSHYDNIQQKTRGFWKLWTKPFMKRCARPDFTLYRLESSFNPAACPCNFCCTSYKLGTSTLRLDFFPFESKFNTADPEDKTSWALWRENVHPLYQSGFPGGFHFSEKSVWDNCSFHRGSILCN